MDIIITTVSVEQALGGGLAAQGRRGVHLGKVLPRMDATEGSPGPGGPTPGRSLTQVAGWGWLLVEFLSPECVLS